MDPEYRGFKELLSAFNTHGVKYLIVVTRNGLDLSIRKTLRRASYVRMTLCHLSKLSLFKSSSVQPQSSIMLSSVPVGITWLRP
jgi:hypothetical protein